jgi:crotonobetainyl-CoA:carnitine CoA-transferase CaiB-like acyl-CoA transferase
LTASRHETGFLEGLRVLELGDGVAGAFACGVLASFGASVTAVVNPAAAYRRGRPGAAARAGSPSLLSLLLERGKQLCELPADAGPEAIEELFSTDGLGSPGGVDVVVADRVSAIPIGLSAVHGADEYCKWVDRINPSAWVTISAFGLSGPRRDRTATELTLAAVSGFLDSVRDAGTAQPLKLAGYQCLLSAGHAAALAACHALDLAAAGDRVHLDLSAQEAAIATGPMLALAQELLNAAGQVGAKRYGAPSSFYPCRDGRIRISAMEDHQWHGIVSAMGHPAWAHRFATTAARVAEPAEIDARVAEWSSKLTKADAEARLQAQGVPATAMYSPGEVLASSQFAHRQALEQPDVAPDATVTVVGLPFRMITLPRPTTRRRRTLRQLRVLEAGHVLAVPLAAALLGALGAKVTKVEDPRRIDMYRRRGPFIDGEEGTNRAAYFAIVNHSKQSVTVDLDADDGPLWVLVKHADVVIENLGRRRADRLGISASALAGSGRDLLAFSSSGFGHDGPQSDYRAYANNLQASFGPFYLTRNEQDEPAAIDLAWADLVSGYAIATIIAAWAVGPGGNAAAGLDFAMAEVIAARFNEFLAAASLNPANDDCVDRANEISPLAPNGVYQVADGWVALSADRDEEFARLRSVLDHPESLEDPRFDSAEDRFAARRELDAAVRGAVSGWGAAELANTVRAAGVEAETVIPARQLPADEHLAWRDFFTAVDHPEWGSRKLIGLPWRQEGGDAIPLAPPPRLRDLEPTAPAGAAGGGRADSKERLMNDDAVFTEAPRNRGGIGNVQREG